ncbi:hypothetical protein [Oceanobacillus caeni]|uniref:hypothetical protein n=1 Tax=Oceanobacillus caeni TaxID=405946 RepID=UPI00363DED7A
MKKFKVTYVPNSKTIECIIEAENEDEAFYNWTEDKNIISEKEIEHDDSSVDVEEI